MKCTKMMVDFQIHDGWVFQATDAGKETRLNALESFEALRNSRQIVPKIQEELAYLQLSIDEADDGIVNLKAMAMLRNAQVSLYSLTEGTDYVCNEFFWIPLNPVSVEEACKLMREANIEGLGPLNFWQQMFLTVQGKRLNPPIQSELRNNTDNLLHSSVIKLDGVIPYPYQEVGFQWLAWLRAAGIGGLLGDEMGLGKTLQIIMLLESEIRANRGPNLVVCPPSLLENWRREILKFAKRDTWVHQGPRRFLEPQKLAEEPFVITSYETLRRDQLFLKEIPWNVIAVDEAQYIKNHSSLRAQAIKSLKKKIGIAVTGTPIENSLRDLWSICDFVVPDLLGTYSWFESNYLDNDSSAERLREIIGPVILRRRISEVADDLPEITIKDVALDAPIEIVKMYRENQRLRTQGYIETFALLTRLRQNCCHLSTDDNNSASTISGKFEYLKDALDELSANDHKAIIFVPFTRAIQIIQDWYQSNFSGNCIGIINGATPISERQNIIDSFSSSSVPGILIMNPKAGGVGLNITAANHVFHFSPGWNPAVIDQASARSYRRGQQLPVTIHNLFYINSVEEYMNNRLTDKRKLADLALRDQNSTPDLNELLEALALAPEFKND